MLQSLTQTKMMVSPQTDIVCREKWDGYLGRLFLYGSILGVGISARLVPVIVYRALKS